MKKVLQICLLGLLSLSVMACKDNSDNEEKNVLIGEWIADGTQKKFITNENGETVGGKNPYYLTIEKDNKYTLKMDGYTENGTYTFEDQNVTFKNSDGLISESCKLENDNELHCDNYASLYKRVEDKK